MKMKNSMKIGRWQLHWIMLALITLCFASCKDDNEEQGGGFDPDKPVVVADFIPKVGGLATRMVLYGDNFGNDPSRVKVIIGGQNAKVIGVNNQNLHCIVPARAYDGDIKVIIMDDNGDEVAHAVSESNFVYKKKMLVSTFLGDYVEKSTDLIRKDGPFRDCGSFETMKWLSFDPENSDHLYMACEFKGTRLIDFEKEYVSTFTTNLNRVPCINWTLSGDLIVTLDQDSELGIGNFLFSRSSGFTSRSDLSSGRGVLSTAIHPINGEMYFTRYRAGDVQQFDFATASVKTIFQNPYARVKFLIFIHPTGDYAYLVESSRHYIMRTDYDWVAKRFMIPYLVCGSAGSAGYADGVGSSVRLNFPTQGVFVKNISYEEQGGDQYDFYFCDTNNHAIRKLTPRGRVETFAGRGNNGTWGYNDGDLRLEARFNSPESIVYDKKRECFYVGDSNNYLIRKIGYEE